LNQPRDRDNKNRKDWTFWRSQAGITPSFALAAAAIYAESDPLELAGMPLDTPTAGAAGDTGAGSAIEGPEERPQTYDYGPEAFQIIPFWKFLTGAVPDSLLKDRIVLVGATAEILHDTYDTPLGVVPGVLLHANRMMSTLEGSPVGRIPEAPFHVALLVLILVLSAIFFRIRAPLSAALLGVLLFAAREACARLFAANILIDVLSIYVTMAGAFALGLAFRSASLLAENRTLRRQSSRDGLTDLFTYRYLERRLKSEFDRSKKAGEALSFVIFDLDHFKKLNDAYGHEKGNDILIAFARILKSCTRGDDLVARYGGEEFCVLLPHKNAAESEQIAERVRTLLESTPFRFSRKGEASLSEIHATVSAGICSTESSEVFNGKELLRLADHALLTAKEEGRNRCVVHKGK